MEDELPLEMFPIFETVILFVRYSLDTVTMWDRHDNQWTGSLSAVTTGLQFQTFRPELYFRG